MSASIGGQINLSICAYILEEGRVRDIGLYQFVSPLMSYRLTIIYQTLNEIQLIFKTFTFKLFRIVFSFNLWSIYCIFHFLC